MQELADKVWRNLSFHDAAHRIELAWLTKEIGGVEDGPADIADATRLMRSAAILACSETADHRRAAFRVATCAYDLFGAEQVPLDQALRVVLMRLGNFPSIGTRADVESAQPSLPFALVAEEIASADAHEVTINGHTVLLTDFQQKLWVNLMQSRRIALAAPTSAGKSFVLQGYLSAFFDNERAKSVVYIVPTRALIAQVAEDMKVQFDGMTRDVPDIVTVPVDADTTLAERAIYVMTQERVQLALGGHLDFSASVIIVDEAHSIADGSRGVLLQWVIDDLLVRNPASQILFASPAIRNLNIFGRLFGLDDVIEFSSVEPTVAQNFLVTTIESATKGKLSIQTAGDGSKALQSVATLQLGRTVASRIEKLVHIPAELGRGHSNIIYANGAAEAESVALQLAELMSDREPTMARLALSIEAASGPEALIAAAAMGADWTMAAIVGCAGLPPTLEALRCGKTVALANKEALVSAGALMITEARKAGATLLPVDSEHNAIFQALQGGRIDQVRKITLTASGGPFRTWTREQMANATPEQAVAHPNWDMGAKISVDSATMMNKGLELIEAHHLFPVGLENIEILVHPQSVIHSMVEYRDCSTLAQLGSPDMRIPIANALAWPERMTTNCEPLNLADIARLDFERPDESRFPATKIARAAIMAGGAKPAMLNAANEVAVAAFLNRAVQFLDITEIVSRLLDSYSPPEPSELADIFAIDKETRVRTEQLVEELKV